MVISICILYIYVHFANITYLNMPNDISLEFKIFNIFLYIIYGAKHQ